eukprot:6601679-Pyramimonas_sp.AAC.1
MEDVIEPSAEPGGLDWSARRGARTRFFVLKLKSGFVETGGCNWLASWGEKTRRAWKMNGHRRMRLTVSLRPEGNWSPPVLVKQDGFTLHCDHRMRLMGSLRPERNWLPVQLMG